MEVDGVDKADYKKVVDQCYLCDLCYLTKCPYVPPHEWQDLGFPSPNAPRKAKRIIPKEILNSETLITTVLTNWEDRIETSD